MHAPMKTLFLILLISFAVLSSFTFLIQNVHAATSVVTTPQSDPLSFAYRRSTTFAALNRSWVFYHNDTYWNWKVKFASDPWSEAIAYDRICGNGAEDYSVWFDQANNKMCVVSHNDTYGDYDVFYRQGTPWSNGVIEWDSEPIFVLNGGVWGAGNVKVIKDSNGYPWIAYIHSHGSAIYTTRVIKALDVNGTSWGSVTQIWAASSSTTVCIVPLELGNIMAFRTKANNKIKYKIYNGTWGAQGDASTTNQCGSFSSYDAVSIGNGTVALSFLQDTTFDVVYIEYDGNTWATEQTIADPTEYCSYPIAITYMGNRSFRIFWIHTLSSIKYRDVISGVMQTPVTVTTGESVLRTITSSWREIVFGNIGQVSVCWVAGNTVRHDSYSTPIGEFAVSIKVKVGDEWYGSCAVIINGTTYYNNDVANLDGGIYTLTHQASVFEFANWTTWYDIYVGNTTSSSTFLQVIGNGTLQLWLLGNVTHQYLIGGYIYVDSIYDKSGLEFKIGNYTFIDGSYHPMFLGNYTLNATCYFDDPETYTFYRWLSYPTGENNIENNTSPLTNVTISASGFVTLFLETKPNTVYTYIRVNDNPPIENLTFTINDVTYANGQYALLWGGDYSINATTIKPYSFINWASVGNVSVQNTTDPTTTITVMGAPSSLTLYLSMPALHIVVRVEDQELEYSYDAVILADKGYRDSDSIQLVNGTYNLSANLAGGYGFLNWETSGATGEHYFGNKTIGGYNTTTPMNQKTAAYGTSYYLDRRANMTTIWLYCWASADVQKGRCGIYSIEGYDIENAVLMGSTQELTGINTTAMWRNFTFAGGLVLEAGSYALIIHAGDISAGLRGKYDAETGSHSQGNVPDTYADGLSNTFGSGGSNISNCYVSIYAEYTYDLLYVHNATEQTTFLTTYAYKVSDVTLTLNLYELPDLTNLYTWIALLLAALFLMIWSPSWVAWGIKKRGVTTETIERLGYGMLLFLVGFGLLVMWLYS